MSTAETGSRDIFALEIMPDRIKGLSFIINGAIKESQQLNEDDGGLIANEIEFILGQYAEELKSIHASLWDEIQSHNK